MTSPGATGRSAADADSRVHVASRRQSPIRPCFGRRSAPNRAVVPLGAWKARVSLRFAVMGGGLGGTSATRRVCLLSDRPPARHTVVYGRIITLGSAISSYHVSAIIRAVAGLASPPGATARAVTGRQRAGSQGWSGGVAASVRCPSSMAWRSAPVRLSALWRLVRVYLGIAPVPGSGGRDCGSWRRAILLGIGVRRSCARRAGRRPNMSDGRWCR